MKSRNLAFAGYTLSSIIAVWGVAAYFRFSNKLRPLHQDLEVLCRLLNATSCEEDFASRIEEVDAKARATRLMGHQWNEFSETLIYPSIDDER